MPTATPSFPLPTVHLNGTGKDDLLSGYKKAYYAAKGAYDALAESTCHARDYYVQSDGAYSAARVERDRHLTNLHATIKYLEAHVAHLI